MSFVVTFCITLAAVLMLRNALKRFPVAFYGVALAAAVALIAGVHGLLPVAMWRPLVLVVQRCMLALSLFFVVMIVGALPRGSKLYRWLRPIRAELSIVASILCLGHVAAYLVPLAMRAFAGALGASVMASFVVSLVLLVLLLVLGVTSFRVVKRHMNARRWKALQRSAYVFFALAYVHVMFMIVPAALGGGRQAILSVVLYTVLFGVYAIARLYRAAVDRRNHVDPVDAIREQGFAAE